MRRMAMAVMLFALLAGCSTPTSAPIPTLAVTVQPSAVAVLPGGGVSASAEIVPLRSAELGFAASGMVQEILYNEGDTVQKGEALARLNNLDQLEAALQASQKSVESAQKALEALSENAPLALAEAQLALTQAQKRYDDAVKKQKRSGFHRCDDDTIDLYFQRYEDAKERLDDVRDQNDGSMGALERLTEAQNVFNTAEANYRYCLSYTAQEIAESDAEMAVSEAGLKIVTSRVDQLTQSQGVDAQQAAVLQAGLAEAQARLAEAQAARDRAVITAPFNGVVTAVAANAGQAVNPGQVIITLADLSEMRIETTDLSERDVLRVQVGQAAQVQIDALGEAFPAVVTAIAPRASKIGGDVVYKVTLAFEAAPPALRWGMTATAVIGE